MTRQSIVTATAVMIAFGLSACSDFRRSIGSEKSKPDEFQVVVRPPLSLPPGFSDNAEKIIQKDQTSQGDAQSQTAKLLGANNVEKSDFTGLFDFSSVPDDIRTKVDEETYGVRLEKRLPLQILFVVCLMSDLFLTRWQKTQGFAKIALRNWHQQKAEQRPLIQ